MRFLSAVLIVALCLSFTAARAVDPIPAEQLTTLLAVVKPAAGEDRWAGIPWRTSLWQAREEAAKAGKPIVLWEMDGHPLGCT
jgi:hypothetical protein